MELITKWTPENITVQPINKAKLDRAITTYFQNKLQTGDNIIYKTGSKIAVIAEPKPCFIDEEFIGGDIKDGFIHLSVWTEDIVNHTFGCFPTYEIKLSINELVEYMDSATTLADFTKQRRGYNSRIIGNERSWMSYLNKVK